MIAYLLNMIICSGYFILIYLLLLEREKMHRFNRFYLLFSVACSVILPLLHFEINKSPAALPEMIYDFNESFTDVVSKQAVIEQATNETNSVPQLLLFCYSLITLSLFVRFARNLYLLNRLIKKADAVPIDGAKLILTAAPVHTHSFLRFIFIHKKKFEAGEIEPEIITHELTHVRQRHSLDIIFMEVMKIFLWFNPFIYLYKRSLQLNHEYLADADVIAAHNNTVAYQQLLLANAVQPTGSLITSSFNYLITKKRLIMMTRNSSRMIALTRQVALIPLFAVAVFFFCIEVAGQTPKPTAPDLSVLSTEWGAGEQVKEYEALVNKYKLPGKEWWKGFEKLTAADRKKMETIFFQMSKEQKNKQIVAFRRPTAPSKRAVPDKSEIEKWKDPKMYGVWIDGKRIKNSVLENYTGTDFGHYSESKLYPTAINYGKHYVQVNLMTNNYYQDYYDKTIADSANVILFKGFNANWKFRF
jgi:bla regulator protein blaR1